MTIGEGHCFETVTKEVNVYCKRKMFLISKSLYEDFFQVYSIGKQVACNHEFSILCKGNGKPEEVKLIKISLNVKNVFYALTTAIFSQFHRFRPIF